MRPGVEVTSQAAAPTFGVPTATDVAFIIGETRTGPVGAPERITSLEDFVTIFGDRLPGSYTYDAAESAFREGATQAYVSRLVAANAVAATVTATAIAAGLTVTAAAVGTWGNGLSLAVIAAPAMDDPETRGNPIGRRRGRNASEEDDTVEMPAVRGEPERSPLLHYDARAAAGDFIAVVSLNGKAVQTSVPLDTVGELRAFAAQGSYIVVSGATDATDVAAGTVTLATGSDGTVPVTGTVELVEALANIAAELGPGQLTAPGRATTADHGALLAHCASVDGKRVALLDAPQGATPDQHMTLAAALRSAAEDRYGSLWGPWATIPGVAPGTTRVVPWSALQAGICARADAAGNVNQAAAGTWGTSRFATGLVSAFTPAECQAMLYAGVNTARTIYGTVCAYAFRTLVDPLGPRHDWRELNHARLNMAIVAESEAIGQDMIFAQLDGRGLTLAAFAGDLAGMLLDHFNRGALYGDDENPDDPSTAFSVNVGHAVNPPEAIADGVMKAVLSVRMSPHAELVQIAIVKVPITIALA